LLFWKKGQLEKPRLAMQVAALVLVALLLHWVSARYYRTAQDAELPALAPLEKSASSIEFRNAKGLILKIFKESISFRG
jgi:hypothetical protein